MLRCTLCLLSLLLLLPAVLCGEAGRRDVTAAVDAMLANPRGVDAALRCFLAHNDDPCTPKGAVVKRVIYSKVRTNCADCSEDYKKGVVRLLAYLSLYRPRDMRRLLTKNDPTGQFLKKYTVRWMAEGILI